MRDLFELNCYRRCDHEYAAYGSLGDRGHGCFEIASPGGAVLTVIATNGGRWDHISVSTPTRCPTWDEMEHVRKIFGKPHEVWVQFGVPAKQHVNNHAYCLHWWRDQRRETRLPPQGFV